jgi:uncharacterized phage protein (TIGR01671 family)
MPVMRDIKFRQWYDGKMRMLDQQFIGVGQVGWSDTHWVDVNSDDQEESALMQNTGIKDKNGVEIYEGDILKWGDHCGWCHEMPVRTAQVEIDPDIQFNSQVGIFHFGNFAYGHPKDGLLEHVEVIGNIYENPELLEAK